ncbi:MAG: hypothetical protein M3539_02735, partial [Acidobacteriota bacterium]|nr:hypothetical protein [Acidobacteriota bacterium]
GQRRQVRLKVNQPNLAVRTRDSYVVNPPGANGPTDTASRQSAPVLQRRFTDPNDRNRTQK